MRGNVHPNPGPIFPCSVCAGNVTWQGKSVQCCTCSKWVHLRCSQLFLSEFRPLGSSHSWSFPSCHNTVTPSSDSSDMYTSTVQSGPLSANAALLPHPRLQTSYPPAAHPRLQTSYPPSLFSFCPLTTFPCSWLFFCASCLLSPFTLSGFFNGMLKVFEPGALNYFTFSRPILSTLSASRNPILTHLPLSRFLDFLVATRTLVAASPFSSGRAYFFLNFLPPLFLRLIPTLITWGSTSLLTTPPHSLFSMCTLPLFTPLQRMAEPTPFLSPFFPPPEISSFWGTSIAISPSGTQEVLPTPASRKYLTGSSLLISFPSMTLTHPPFYIAPLLTSPLLPLLLLLEGASGLEF